MAQMLHSTRFKSPVSALATFTITIPATAAGSKLVVVAGGGATIQAKLGAGGTSFTRRTNSLNNREVVAQDIVDAAGGSTVIEFVLNGPENIDGVIYEFASGTLGNFIAGNTEANTNITSVGGVATNTVTTSGAAVLFAMFTLDESSSTPSPTNKMFGFEPLGKQFANEFILPDPTKTKYWSLIAVSDQLSAGTFAAATSGINTGTGQQSCVWAYQNLAPGTPSYTNPYANKTAEENSLPGQLEATWFGITTDGTISGYTDAMSYAAGDTVNFKVDSGNSAFSVAIYRVGFYGYELFGAKLKATVTGTPAVQSAPTINAYGGSECAWSTTATWAVPSDATPGIYIYLMNRSGQRSQGIFIVRPTVPSSQANQIMLTTADFTWQAYNVWGAPTDTGTGPPGFTGRSLYMQAPAGGTSSRAFAVSYDRPMGTVGSNTTTYFWDSEFALVNFLEGNGYDMAYYSMVDIEKNTAIPSRYKIAISSGHSEYWTTNLRDAFEAARDAGTNLFLVTSNTALWHTRFDPADTNRRNMICYKDSHDTVGYDGTTKYDPVLFTGTWRDLRTVPGGVNNTARRPESGMTGQWFIGNGTFEERLAVPATYSSLPIWRNTAMAVVPTITVRGTGTASVTNLGTSFTINQPAGTQVGDLLVLAVTFTGTVGINFDAPFRLVRQTDSTGPGGQTMALFAGYALTAGTGVHTISWVPTGPRNASATLVCYGNAVWEDLDSSLLSDLGNTAAHTTRLISNDGATRWAVCVFADNNTTGTSKTTSWTAGAGLTSRAQADNSASVGGPWCSTAIMDTNGATTQGAHQYTATAQFANPQAFAGIFYISPGTVSSQYRTVGAEWDYLKAEEPSTSKNMVRLSRQTIPLKGATSNYNGNSYSESGLFYYGLTMYQAPSGALVFNTGSWRFTFGLSRFRRGSFDSGGDVDVNLQQATLNILRDLGIAPTTLMDTTANLNATPLVDPGSAAAASAYGFPVATPTVYQNIFGATPPQNFNASDNVSYTLGTLFTAGVGGKVYGMRWHFPGQIPDAPVIAVLYSWTSDAAGTEITRVTFANMQTGWNDVLFSSPVTINSNTRYIAAIWTMDRYVSTSGTFTSAGITSGDLTAPQDTPTAHNGKFVSPSSVPAYPSSTFSASSYLVDVLFIGEGFEGWGIPIS
ncbi:MAG TPA: N,N-dimethylformamidase beta subunit family domain-containing protein [Patescibacteria group bacterium]|nr:N,N-dimethylformamidase beta subunit family domain-containing protein [Patescibacteria group bacterium]